LRPGYFSRVYQIVSRIPAGKVATYGQIALLLGNPRGARTVGWALHSNPYPKVVPCHRVVNKEGELSGGFAFGGGEKQRSFLEEEGVHFLPDGRVDLKGHLWQPER
jgi:methylated-DNA-protein-cysteine methyltransferase related protein